jgi:hypothetical protein
MGNSYSSSWGSVVNHFDIWRAGKGAFALYVRVFITMVDIQSIVGSSLPT